jgi:hypothetical protein
MSNGNASKLIAQMKVTLAAKTYNCKNAKIPVISFIQNLSNVDLENRDSSFKTLKSCHRV